MSRAPIRTAASVLAIALAIAATGVFAAPGVARSSIREAAAEDNLAHIEIPTTPMSQAAIAEFSSPAGLELLETRVVGTIEMAALDNVLVVGRSSDAQIDRLRLSEGRLPLSPLETVVSPGLADAVGSGGNIDLPRGPDTVTLSVVGVGETTWFSDEELVLFTTPDAAQELLGVTGINRWVARHEQPTAVNLDRVGSVLRSEILATGASMTALPSTLEGGAHPVEEDLAIISSIIGSMGVVAGVIALVLLASTANSVVTERSRDAAIMLAVGGSRRAVRRDLRRVAITSGVIGTVLGLPLGTITANVLARMVLTRFAGITPDVGLDIPVMATSLVFGIAGARIVSGHAARRVTETDLAAALRDSRGSPPNDRWMSRLLARFSSGDLLSRMAFRSVEYQRARSLAVAAQFAGATAAAVLVASLATSILAFNDAQTDELRWTTATVPEDHVFPFALDGETPGTEVGIHTWARTGEWEVELYGVDPATVMFDTAVVAGDWLSEATSHETRSVVLAEGFALQEGFAVGDTLPVTLATGPVEYEIVGLHPIRSLSMFVTDTLIANDLKTNGRGDVAWTRNREETLTIDGLATTTTARDDLCAADSAAREAILVVFGVVGATVVGVAALGAASTVAMNLYERRTEVATLLALGARSVEVRKVVRRELGPLALLGWTAGVGLGALGARSIMGFLENANGIDLGFVFAWPAVPLTAAGAIAFIQLLTLSTCRNLNQRTAATLRAAT